MISEQNNRWWNTKPSKINRQTKPCRWKEMLTNGFLLVNMLNLKVIIKLIFLLSMFYVLSLCILNVFCYDIYTFLKLAFTSFLMVLVYCFTKSWKNMRGNIKMPLVVCQSSTHNQCFCCGSKWGAPYRFSSYIS